MAFLVPEPQRAAVTEVLHGLSWLTKGKGTLGEQMMSDA